MAHPSDGMRELHRAGERRTCQKPSSQRIRGEDMREKISRQEVRHVANLARLDLSDAEEARMTEQMNNILGYMDKLNELDTTDVPATTHAIELRNVFRGDEVVPSLDRQSALANAPQSDGVSFVVPKII